MLPPGLSLNPKTGEISGTPTVAGKYSPVIMVRDAEGSFCTFRLSMTVTEPGSAPAQPVVTEAPPTHPYKALGYYWPRIWLSAPPEGNVDTCNLDSLRDLVCERDVAQGIRVKAYRCGFFVFDFSNWTADTPADPSDIAAVVARKMQRVRVFNVHLMCLNDAAFRTAGKALPKRVIHHGDVYSAYDFEDAWKGLSWSLAADNISDVLFSSVSPTDKQVDSYCRKRIWETFPGRCTITDEELNHSLNLLAAILNHRSDYSLLRVELLGHSCKAFEEHNYEQALITAWCVIEKLLDARWDAYIKAQRAVKVEIGGEKVAIMNADRAQKLSGRDYTSSVVIEFLTCLELLPFDLYGALDQVRRARNDWMHSLRAPTHEAAGAAIMLALNLMREVEKIDLSVALVLRLAAIK